MKHLFVAVENKNNSLAKKKLVMMVAAGSRGSRIQRAKLQTNALEAAGEAKTDSGVG